MVDQTEVFTMWWNVVIVTKNQYYGGKWLILEVIVDIVWVYAFYSGDEVDYGVQKVCSIWQKSRKLRGDAYPA